MGLAGLAGSTCRRGDRAEEAEVAGARREKERKEMTGGVAVSVGGERDAALRNVADDWARLVSGRRGTALGRAEGAGRRHYLAGPIRKGGGPSAGKGRRGTGPARGLGLLVGLGFGFLIFFKLNSNLI